MTIGAPVPIGSPVPLGDYTNVLITLGMTGDFSVAKYGATFTGCFIFLDRYGFNRVGTQKVPTITCNVKVYLSYALYLAGSQPLSNEVDTVLAADLDASIDEETGLIRRLLLLSKYSACTAA